MEYALRRLYFSNAFDIVGRYQRFKIGRLEAVATDSIWDDSALTRYLRDRIPASRDIILHCSMAGIGSTVTAQSVLDFFLSFCGEERNLLMPSHPILKEDLDGLPVYNPNRSASTVGMVSELARRRPDFSRSLHPFSSVVAYGRNAESYLAENLNGREPLPHGKSSPYARLAENEGFAICLGVPFIKCLTMIHVAEETLDQEFPKRLIFDRHAVRIEDGSCRQVHVVRKRSEQHLANISMKSIKRDLIDNGAVIVGSVNGIIVDICDCRRVVSYMKDRAIATGYPYVFIKSR